MKKFKYTVKDDFFPQTFEGEICAYNMIEAASEIKEFYALELDTEASEITIVSIQEVIS